MADWRARARGAKARRQSRGRTKSAPGAGSRVAALRPILSGAAPGLWASDHWEELRHNTGWQFVAVRTVAKACAAAELEVRRVAPPRGTKARRARAGARSRTGDAASAGPFRPRPLAESHRLVRLLRRPNPDWSLATLLFACAQQICLTGSALIWRVNDGFGFPAELYLIPTAVATPQRPTPEYPRGSYRVAPLAAWASAAGYSSDFEPPGALGMLLAGGAVLDSRSVKPVRWPHPLVLSDGLSPLAAGALWVDLDEQKDRSRWYAMKNGVHAGLVLEQSDPDAPISEDDKAAFRADLKARNAGTANTGKDLLLPPGVKPHKVDHTPDEMDYTGAHTQLRDAGLALHQVSPVAAGVSEAGSYAAFFASLLQTTVLAVQPVLDLIGGELGEELGAAWGGGIEVKLHAREINDPALLEQRLANDLKARALTVNEWRELRGLPPVPWGDVPVGAVTAPGPGQAREDPGGSGAEGETGSEGASAPPGETTTGVADPNRAGAPRPGKHHLNGHRRVLA